MALWSRFFGSAGSQAAGFTIGLAAGPALAPAVQDLVNAAWYTHPNKPLRSIQLAMGVASGQVDRVWAEGEARFDGTDSERFGNLVRVFDAGPGTASAFEMWRRGLIDEATFRRALKRESLEAEWIDALVALRNVLLSPDDLAAMRQRGYIDADRHHEEAGKQGVTNERADLMFENSGLPPGYGELRDMLHRRIITRAEFVQAIREANTKVKYTDELLALSDPILSPTQAATLRLKGWISAEQSYEIGALSGYSPEQMDRLFLAQGRPAAPVQMFNGWARGIDGPDGVPMNKAQFLKGIRESDIRPEWGEMLWGIRHAYPSLFQLRRAVQDGGISRARALTILHYERYEDADATALVDSWLVGTGTTAKGLTATDLANEYEALWLTRAQYVSQLQQLGYTAESAAAKADAEDARRARKGRDALVARIHTQYVAHRISRDTAIATLNSANVPARVRDSLLPDWDLERSITPDALTPAQIKKAFAHAVFTRPEAIVRLEAKGYDETDAGIYLDE